MSWSSSLCGSPCPSPICDTGASDSREREIQPQVTGVPVTAEIHPHVSRGLQQAQVVQKGRCSAGEIKKSITGKPSLSFLTAWVIYTPVYHITQQEHCNASSTRAVKGPAQLPLQSYRHHINLVETWPSRYQTSAYSARNT